MALDDRWVELVRQVQEHAPLCPGALNWAPEEIVLTRGCDARPHEAIHCERIIATVPGARVRDLRHLPHSRVPIPGHTTLERLAHGKRTLVLGAIRTPVSPNCDPETGAGTLCARYLAVHPTWFCFYDCAFCYLSGSPGVSFSPTVRLFTNLQDILAAMQRALARDPGVVSFYVGKVQDGLQLDPLSLHARVLGPFVRAHPRAHLVFLTKSQAVDGLLDATADLASPDTAGGKVVVSWSLNPTELAHRYEWNAPGFEARLEAARRCAQAGLEVRFVFMPLLPVPGWQEAYTRAISHALRSVTPTRITLGGICSYPNAMSATCARLGRPNLIADLASTTHGRRLRFDLATRTGMYVYLRDLIRELAPEVPVSLCLESREAWTAAGLDAGQCRCNCIAGACDLRSAV